MTSSKTFKLLCVNTAGVGDLHGIRMRRLTDFLPPRIVPTHIDLDKSRRRSSSAEFWQILTREPWDLVYQESTGIVGGIPLIRAGRQRGQRYVVSSGDPVSGFFRVTRGAAFAAPFAVYEKQLYAGSAGFIGWTPYLAGRALELGARSAVTIEGAADMDLFRPLAAEERRAARVRLGLHPDHLVCGVVGSLTWVPKQQYCYGLELVETLRRAKRTDLSVLIVGDGDGRARLEAAVPDALRSRIVFAGRIPHGEVVAAMNAMDIGFITQTLDELGSYRLTTKLPEYLACGLPVAMSPIPGFFDYVGEEGGWALPPAHPASAEFAERCARWLDGLDRQEVAERAARCRPLAEERFDYERIGRRFARFIEYVLES